MPFLFPTTDDFKARFFRDFRFGQDINTCVTDQDLMNAFSDATADFPTALFVNQTEYSLACLLLAAHHLVMNLKAAQGVSGQFEWLHNSKAAGNVNESFSIPERILENPELAMLAKTHYGAKYLQMILPRLSGQMFGSHGGTHP